MNRGARKREPRRHARKHQPMSPEARARHIRRIQKRKEDTARKQVRFEKRVVRPLRQELYVAMRTDAPESEVERIRRKIRHSRRGNGHFKRKLRKLAHEERMEVSAIIQEEKAVQKAERMKKYQQRHFKKRKTVRSEVPLEVRRRKQIRQIQNAQSRVVRKVLHYVLRNDEPDIIDVTVALTVDAKNGEIGRVRDYYEPEHKPESSIRRKVKRFINAVDRHDGDPTPGIIALVWDAYQKRPLSIAKYQRLAGART